MARRPILGTGSLSPFGGAGTNFDAFNVAASMGEQAYLAFRKKEVEWEAGRISNDEYLAALQAYGNALPEGSEKFNAQNRYEETKSRIARNTLIGDIEDGTKEWNDLLTYDLGELAKVTNQNSTAYDERLGNVREVQGRIFAEQEDVQQERYSDGLMTAAQLRAWYEDRLASDLTANNPDLDEAIGKRIDDLGDTVVNERDAKMVNDFNAGKVGYTEFLAYGNAARGRFAKGTPQYSDWTERLDDARDTAVEQSITYRYGLSQRYADLQRFVKDHGTAPAGSTTTSTSGGKKGTTRVVWTGSGWKTVRVGATAGGTKTTYHAPSASELKAWKELQLEVKAAKTEMTRIASQIGRQPGGWVSTTDMIRYYTAVKGRYVTGSPEWYNVQERLDGLAQQASKEKVFQQKGLKISFPAKGGGQPEYGTPGAPGVLPPGPGTAAGQASAAAAAKGLKAAAAKKPSTVTGGDRSVSVEEFMKAIARVESGGRYDAVNRSSGARGKYQIMPANWAGWAKKYLGNANATMTPANQEKVVRGKMTDLYKWLGDWRAVAHWWLTGGSDAAGHRNPSSWSTSSKSYVNKVFAGLGMSPTQVSGTAYTTAGAGGGGAPPGTAAAGYPSGGPGAVRTTGAGTPSPAPVQIRIPKGLDSAQFERFYDRFLDAYESGEENFVDYSTGRAINYFIPADLAARSDLVAYLDQVRIGAFAAKAQAYAGSPSEMVARTQYSDAIKKAGENQMLILDTNNKPPVNYGYNIPGGGGQLGIKAGYRAGPAKAINPIAEGLQLKAYAESALASAAAAAKKAFARGDIEMAYSLIQHGLNLAATNEEQLRAYYANAQASIRAFKKVGAKVPELVGADLEKLAAGLDFDASDVGGASPGYAKALASLDETSNEIEKWVQFDDNDEPKRVHGATDLDDRFQLKAGIDLYLNPDGTVEYKKTQFTGWTDPHTPSRDKDKYVSVAVKVGTSVKQAKAPWEVATIGYIKGTNIPVQGKVITGSIDGREYIWVENPFTPGKWIRTDPSKPLQINAPAGLNPIKNPDGTVSLEFTTGKGGGWLGGAGNKYRMAFDDDDGTYHVYSPPGFLQTEWTDLGSASSSSDLAGVYKDAGWKVDRSQFSGEDGYFFDSTGPWVGFTQRDRELAIRNTQSSTQPGGGFNPVRDDWRKDGIRPPSVGPTGTLPARWAAERRNQGNAVPGGRPYGPAGATYGPGSAGYGPNQPPLVPPVRDDWRKEGRQAPLPPISRPGAVPPGHQAAQKPAAKQDYQHGPYKKKVAAKPAPKPKQADYQHGPYKRRVVVKPAPKPVAKKPVAKKPAYVQKKLYL